MMKREMGDEDAKDVEETSEYKKSGVQLAQLGWEHLLLVLFHARLGLVPAL